MFVFSPVVSIMKANRLYWIVLFCVSVLLTARAQSQFQYITNSDSTITITKFTGLGGQVTIPDTINGHTVTAIGDLAFFRSVLFGVTIPDSVTSIGNSAFAACDNLYSVTIPRNVTSIGDGAFYACLQLAEVYLFEGAKIYVGIFAFQVQEGVTKAKFYYLPGTPVILDGSGQFSGHPGVFQFTVSWVSGQNVVIEMATDLAHPNWQPLSTNTITYGVFQFVDFDATQHPIRLYRARPK